MAQKQHSRPGKGWGQEAAGLPLALPDPLAGPRHPSGHFPTSSEGRKEEGEALAKEKKQGRGEVITTEAFGGKRAEHYDRG